ncbi:hypothetical protein Bbelb_219190 [Branchiostoma belcheri]|nr:hypothetical protein Bbelb_219190 [Branchiostoma belcheri]
MKLEQLEVLILSKNKNITLPEEMCSLVNLSVLDLASCDLTSVPAAVTKLSQLNRLRLWNNKKIKLPDEMSSLINLTYLDLGNCDKDTLPPVVLKLSNLQELDLSNNQISLPEELYKLENIKVLRLRGCNLTTVPPVVLKLTQLEELDLSRNRGIHLPDELSGLKNIRVLKLWRTVPPVVWRLRQLEWLTNVKHLDLSECKLRTLPPEVGRLRQLEWLDLSSNPLQTLPMEIGQLTNVKHLDLSECKLRTLPPEIGTLTQLEWLDLSPNPLKTLPMEIGKLTNIKHLDLSKCELHTLPPEMWRLTQLEWLDLSYNPLQTLPAEIGQLTNVKHLYLSSCKLRPLPPEVWRLTQLEWLDLSYNPLQTLPAEIGQLTNVKHLYLSSCKLRPLPPEVWRLTQLEWLDLSLNPLQKLPADIGQLANIKHLHLSKCELCTLPPEVWRLTQLERLDLSWNRLQTLPAEIGQLINVKHLDLSRCQLSTLPTELWRLTQLKWLDLSYNRLQTLPEEVGQIVDVKQLDLSKCDLRTLPPEVWRLTQLDYLNLNSNALQVLPAEIGQLTSIKHLHLSECELRTLPPEVGRLTQLEWLNLRFNPLRTLPMEIGNLTNIKHLNLSKCELRKLPAPKVCSPTEILDWMERSSNTQKTLTMIGKLTNIKHLHLSKCELPTLPPEIGTLTQLEWLDLSSSTLQTLPMKIGKLTNIKHLHLSKCELRTLPPEIGTLTQLERLDLSSNALQTLPMEIGKLTSIKLLDLSKCELRTLPPEVWRLTQIDYLNLSSNALQVLPAEIGQLTSIKHLHLSKCQLSTLPPELGILTQLEWLNLRFNPLQTLPMEIGHLTNIKHLHLSECELRTLPPEVERLAQLEWLDLSSNALQTLSMEIGKLTNIKHLDLSKCELRTLPPEMCRLVQLEWLDLSSNALQTLSMEIGKLTSIKHLDLSKCELRTLPPEVERLTQLEWLDLSSNALQTLSTKIVKLTNIKHLDLSKCELRTLPPEMCRLAQLEWLDLSSNALQTLSMEIGKLTNIKHLDLSNCHLHTLPPEVGRLTQLKRLRLSDNSLEAFPVECAQLTNAFSIDISGNPLIKPPAEVCRQGIVAIRQYFDELERSQEEVSACLKVVVLGEKMAGKTSLVQTLSRGHSILTKEGDRTHCVEITQWAPNNNITFEVYDFGGHDVYHLTHQFFLTPDAFYLLVVNLQTYSRTERGFKESVAFWLDTLNARVPGAVVSIVGSKSDLCRHDDVNRKTKDIQRMVNLYVEAWEGHLKQQIARLTSMQATQERGHSKSMKDIAQQLEHTNHLLRQRLHIVGDVLCVSVKPIKSLIHWISSKPPSWIHLKKLLLETGNNKALFSRLRRVLPRTWVLFEQMLQRSIKETEYADDSDRSDERGSVEERKLSSHRRIKQPARYYLTSAEYESIGREAELSSERLEPVLSYLQQVGTILRYTDIPELKDFIFHDPPALIEIFKNLFHHETSALFSTPGVQNAFTREQRRNFEQDLRKRGLIRKDVMTCLLPSNINPDIVTALMQYFGLCFEIQLKEKSDPSEHISWYRIPWYLREEMPLVMPREVPEDQEQLQLICNITGFCPRGLFQRFSVGIHPRIKDRVDWKDGVMAYRQDYPVLVCSRPVADDTYITMATRGRLDQADEMWGAVHPLLEVLVHLLQEWPGVLYSLHVTCAHCIKAGLEKPYQYDLRDRAEDDGRDVRCPGVDFAASTSADLVYRPSRLSGSNQGVHVRGLNASLNLDADVSGPTKEQAQEQLHVKPHDKSQTKDELDMLKCPLTDMKGKDDAYEDSHRRRRLSARVYELGLTFRAEVPGDGNCMFHAVSDQVFRSEGKHIGHQQLRKQAAEHLRRNPCNADGDHLSKFVSNQSWEEYLETMSRDGTWGDHIVLQAMADMLGHDVIIVSSVEADNYVTTLHPQSGAPPRAGGPLLLGHCAENHYASLDEKPSGGKPVVLLVNDEFGTSKGGISTINGQLWDLLTFAGAKVIITVLNATEEEKKEALSLGIDLILPTTTEGDKRTPTLNWLTYNHKSRYPNIPLDINVIVGHADITSKAARNIRKDRLPLAKFILFNHVMPEDTEHYKSDDRVMTIEDKMDAIRKDTENADVVFSVGPTMYDYYKRQIRLSKPHHLFLPKPSDIFSQMDVTYVETETKVVLCVGRVKGVEKLKGYDLVAKAMDKVLGRFPRAILRVRGVSAEDFPESKAIIQANIAKGTFHFTPLKYGTQQQLSRDLEEAHVVLMPSRAEPFGLVGLEAIAAGVPTIVSDQSGLAKFLKAQDDVIFDRPIVKIKGNDEEDATRLADRIAEILENGRKEFKAAKEIKQKLLASKYWEESHRKFLEECGIQK